MVRLRHNCVFVIWPALQPLQLVLKKEKRKKKGSHVGLGFLVAYALIQSGLKSKLISSQGRGGERKRAREGVKKNLQQTATPLVSDWKCWRGGKLKLRAGLMWDTVKQSLPLWAKTRHVSSAKHNEDEGLEPLYSPHCSSRVELLLSRQDHFTSAQTTQKTRGGGGQKSHQNTLLHPQTG